MRQAAFLGMLTGLILTAGMISPALSQTQPLKREAGEALVQMRLRSNPDAFRLEKIPPLQNTRPIRILIREGAFAIS